MIMMMAMGWPPPNFFSTSGALPVLRFRGSTGRPMTGGNAAAATPRTCSLPAASRDSRSIDDDGVR